MKTYALWESRGILGRALVSNGHPTITAAVMSIPAKVVHWSMDDDGYDAADAFAENGCVYVIERDMEKAA